MDNKLIIYATFTLCFVTLLLSFVTQQATQNICQILNCANSLLFITQNA